MRSTHASPNPSTTSPDVTWPLLFKACMAVRLPGIEKITFLVMFSHADGHQKELGTEIFPGLATMVREGGFKEHAMRKARRALLERRLVLITQHPNPLKHRIAKYALNVPLILEAAASGETPPRRPLNRRPRRGAIAAPRASMESARRAARPVPSERPVPVDPPPPVSSKQESEVLQESARPTAAAGRSPAPLDLDDPKTLDRIEQIIAADDPKTLGQLVSYYERRFEAETGHRPYWPEDRFRVTMRRLVEHCEADGGSLAEVRGLIDAMFASVDPWYRQSGYAVSFTMANRLLVAAAGPRPVSRTTEENMAAARRVLARDGGPGL